uniref:G protein gamma domain-containing protein n=1 Tax=Buteo japonicus TaxID=224669 RepID=A0A8C0AUV4_9AVES
EGSWDIPPGDAFCSGGLCPPLRSPPRRFVKWIEDGIPEDPFLNPELMKNNPWVEKGKCTIL